MKAICDKFGGSSFPDYMGFMQAAEYLSCQIEEGYRPIAVVSAPKGVSDMLIDAAAGRLGMDELKDSLLDKYSGMVRDMFGSGREARNAKLEIEAEMGRLREAIEKEGKDCFLSLGENHSSILLAHAIRALGHGSSHADGYTAGVTVTKRGAVVEDETDRRLRATLDRQLSKQDIIPVIGGYVGDCDGRYVIMGRNTTDVTGALISRAAGAEAYEIIKDVPGVYRVEPEFCETEVIDRLSYDEAGQITWRGAKVVHPHAITVARKAGIPIRVRNMYDAGFTTIHHDSSTTEEKPVAAISARRFYMINVSDDAMNTPEGRGYLAMMSSVLSAHDIDILDAAMPANTISVVIPVSEHTRNGIEEELAASLAESGYSPVIEGREVGGISITGEAMKGRPGTLSYLSGILGRECVSVVMGSQSDEAVSSPTINFYVEGGELDRTVKRLCEELFA
ncbi:MAG: hypothetical protein DRO99_01400 [Candidatus Aenigmatarchaeota archaeon]|mgnify:CR=1 FL=1|nr:MAG: hypothetical protein DRO99_01400 [Candidatus Aenigmarchaeota archaeon]